MAEGIHKGDVILDYRKLLFIYNPKSGRGVVENHLSEIIKAFNKEGFTTTVYGTKAPGDDAAVAADIGADFERVVCAGGDGTLNGVISGIMQIPKEKRPPVGFIPTGSTNDTRLSYDLPAEISQAAKIAVSGKPFETDIGTCNDRYFTYVASLGELSAVSCFTSQVAKQLLGHAAYITEGIKALLKMQSHRIRVTYDGENVIEGDYFLGMVTNALSVGGFANITGRNVDLQDGLFEVLLLQKPANLLEFNKEVETVILAAGKPNAPAPDELAEKLVFRFKASRLKFESEEDIQWVVDGEDAGRHKVTDIANNGRAVTIITGKA